MRSDTVGPTGAHCRSLGRTFAVAHNPFTAFLIRGEYFNAAVPRLTKMGRESYHGHITVESYLKRGDHLNESA